MDESSYAVVQGVVSLVRGRDAGIVLLGTLLGMLNVFALLYNIYINLVVLDDGAMGIITFMYVMQVLVSMTFSIILVLHLFALAYGYVELKWSTALPIFLRCRLS